MPPSLDQIRRLRETAEAGVAVSHSARARDLLLHGRWCGPELPRGRSLFRLAADQGDADATGMAASMKRAAGVPAVVVPREAARPRAERAAGGRPSVPTGLLSDQQYRFRGSSCAACARARNRASRWRRSCSGIAASRIHRGRSPLLPRSGPGQRGCAVLPRALLHTGAWRARGRMVEGARLLTLAAEQGHAGSQLLLARMNRDAGGPAAAVRDSSETGDAVAQRELGQCCYLGKGVPQNYREARPLASSASQRTRATRVRRACSRPATRRGLAC
jgi:TPR repeat protein